MHVSSKFRVASSKFEGRLLTLNLQLGTLNLIYLNLFIGRQRHGESRAAPLAFRLGADRAAVEFDEVPDYREAEAEPAVLSGRGAVRLPEALEDAGQEVSRDADARIGDREFDVRVVRARESNGDVPARVRELQRVEQKLFDDLPKARGVARDVARVRVERDFETYVSRRGLGLHVVHSAVDGRGQIDAADAQAQTARDRARHVEYVFDQLRLHQRVPLNRVERARGRRLVELCFHEQV